MCYLCVVTVQENCGGGGAHPGGDGGGHEDIQRRPRIQTSDLFRVKSFCSFILQRTHQSLRLSSLHELRRPVRGDLPQLEKAGRPAVGDPERLEHLFYFKSFILKWPKMHLVVVTCDHWAGGRQVGNCLG